MVYYGVGLDIILCQDQAIVSIVPVYSSSDRNGYDEKEKNNG